MPEDTTPKPPAKKGAKGASIFSKKVGGIPVPVLAVGGGIAVYLLYQHFHNASSATTSSVATPTSSTGTTGGGGTSGSGTGGGGGGWWTPSSTPSTTTPSTTTPTTTTPTPLPGKKSVTAKRSTITPIGKKVVHVGGTPFNTVSGFTQNGDTYYGVNNPGEAKKLEEKGVTLVHNPNDPTGKGLFIKQPAGSPSIPTHTPPVADRQPVVTGHSGTGTDYGGTGVTGHASPAPATTAEIKAANQRAANERKAANQRAANTRRAANRKAANETQAAKNATTALHGR